MSNLNDGIDVAEILEFRERVRRDRAQADRNPRAIAHWVGGGRSRIESSGLVTYLGGDGEFNAMRMLLACLAACDVDVVALHASLLELKIESLSVEAAGHFNVRAYLGLPGGPGPGYSGITYTVRLRAPGATPEQIAHLRERLEASSPVGDSLGRAIPLSFSLQVEPEPIAA